MIELERIEKKAAKNQGGDNDYSVNRQDSENKGAGLCRP